MEELQRESQAMMVVSGDYMSAFSMKELERVFMLRQNLVSYFFKLDEMVEITKLVVFLRPPVWKTGRNGQSGKTG